MLTLPFPGFDAVYGGGTASFWSVGWGLDHPQMELPWFQYQI